MVNPDFLNGLNIEFSQSEDSKKLKRLIAIDGKTMRGNRSNYQEANHIVTAYDGGNRMRLGQVVVADKRHEITAIPRLLRKIDSRKAIVTIDAMGTQTDTVDEIIKGKADYCLAVKGNQGTLKGVHDQMIEKARSQIDVRDYWVSYDVNWLAERYPKWQKRRGIGMTKNRIDKDGVIIEETRQFILSFKPNVQTFSQVVRSHWSVESLHWLLDVVYREDHHQTLDKRAAFNLNAIRKICRYCLKVMAFSKKDLSYRRKQGYIAVHLEDYLPQLFGK